MRGITKRYPGVIIFIILVQSSRRREKLKRMKELWVMGWSRCLVEGDSKVVVSWASGSFNGSWKFAHYIHEIKSIIRELSILVSHVIGIRFGPADSLATWGAGLLECFSGNWQQPSGVLGVFN